MDFKEGKKFKVDIILEHECVATKDAVVSNQDMYQAISDKLNLHELKERAEVVTNKRKRGNKKQEVIAPAPPKRGGRKKEAAQPVQKVSNIYDYDDDLDRIPRKKGAKKLKTLAKGKKTKKQESVHDLEEEEDMDEELNSQQLYNLENELELELKKYDHEHSQHDYEHDYEDMNLKSKENLYGEDFKDIFDDEDEIGGQSSKKNLTQRQKNLLTKETIDIDFLTLPDKNKKKRNNYISEEEQIKKMEREEKRRAQMAKQQENQKWEVVNKILNESGRKQKQRKEKEEKEIKSRTSHVYKQLPENEVRIKFISNKDTHQLQLSKELSNKTLVNQEYNENYTKLMQNIMTTKYYERQNQVVQQIQEAKEKEKELKQLKKEKLRNKQQIESDDESDQDFDQKAQELSKKLEDQDKQLLTSQYFENEMKQQHNIDIDTQGQVQNLNQKSIQNQEQKKERNAESDCSICGKQGKYKIPKCKERACSLQCYKEIKIKMNK